MQSRYAKREAKKEGDKMNKTKFRKNTIFGKLIENSMKNVVI